MSDRAKKLLDDVVMALLHSEQVALIDDAFADLERQLDEAKVNHEAEIVDFKAELDDDRQVVNEAMNDIWGIVYPGKDDWDYFGMVFRHVNALVGELRSKNAAMEEALKVCLQYIDDERDGNIATIRPRYEVRAAIRDALPSEGDDGKN